MIFQSTDAIREMWLHSSEVSLFVPSLHFSATIDIYFLRNTFLCMLKMNSE